MRAATGQPAGENADATGGAAAETGVEGSGWLILAFPACDVMGVWVVG